MSLAERLPEGGEGPSAALVLDAQRVRAGASGIWRDRPQLLPLRGDQRRRSPLRRAVRARARGVRLSARSATSRSCPKQADELELIAGGHVEVGSASTLVRGQDAVAAHMRHHYPDRSAAGVHCAAARAAERPGRRDDDRRRARRDGALGQLAAAETAGERQPVLEPFRRRLRAPPCLREPLSLDVTRRRTPRVGHGPGREMVENSPTHVRYSLHVSRVPVHRQRVPAHMSASLAPARRVAARQGLARSSTERSRA